MYSDTITLFNRYHSRLGDIWFPHILHNVDLIIDKGATMSKFGAETSDVAKLHIKYDKGLKIEGKPYLDSKEWYKLTTDEMKDYITFNPDGNYFDFFVIGEWGDESPVSDEEFNEGFYEYMEYEYGCYVISSVSSPYKVIPHFELLAR